MGVHSKCLSHFIDKIIPQFYYLQATIWTLNPSNECMQDCPQPCQEVKLFREIKDNIWPQKSSTEYDAYSKLDQLANITPSDLTQHLVQLNVIFQVKRSLFLI